MDVSSLVFIAALLSTSMAAAQEEGTLTTLTKHNWESSGASRAPFALHIALITNCSACHVLLEAAQNASHVLREHGTGANIFVINASDSDSMVVEGELADALRSVHTFPATFITHFGRVNTDLRRIPRTNGEQLARFLVTMSKPPSAEVRSGAELAQLVQEHANHVTIVVGYYSDTQSSYRLTEIAESFRGLVNFYHVSPQRNEEIQIESGSKHIYRDTFVIYKQRLRGDVNIFEDFARRKPKRPTARVRFDPMKADQSYDPTPVAPKPSPAEIRAGGATAWFASPTVDYAAVHRDVCGESCVLHGEGFSRDVLLSFVSRQVFPPVDLLTRFNRDHFNYRTPSLVLTFVKAVGSMPHEDTPVGSGFGLQDERSTALRQASQLRYLTTRYEQLSDTFTNFTFLFATYEENAQVFHQFGLDREAYESGSTALIAAVVNGDKKYVFSGGVFSPSAVEAWLGTVTAGTATGFVRSSNAPEYDPEPGTGDLGIVVYHTIGRVTESAEYDSLVYFSHDAYNSEASLTKVVSYARAEKNNTRLNVLFFDGLDNDPPQGFGFDALPCLFFVRSRKPGNETFILLYKGDFSFESIAGFVQEQATWPPQTNVTRVETLAAPRTQPQKPASGTKQQSPPKPPRSGGGIPASGQRTFALRDGKVVPDDEL